MVEYLNVAILFDLQMHIPQVRNEIIYLDQSVFVTLGTCHYGSFLVRLMEREMVEFRKE